MAVNPVPDKVNTFFTTYPQGKDLFLNEDGTKVYLNHFREQAIKEAKQDGKELWKINSGGNQVRVWPEGQPSTGYTYELIYDASTYGIEIAEFAGQTITVDTPSDPNSVVDAYTQLISSSSFTGNIDLLEDNDTWTFTINIDGQTVVRATNANNELFTFTETPA
jgi:hypothetical protein